MISVVRSRMLSLGACGLAVGAIAVGVGASSGDSPPGNHFSRLTGNPPLGFSPRTTSNPPASVALTSGWQYLADPSNVGLRDDWAHGGASGLAWASITVPHVMNPTVSPDTDVGTDGWYRLTFTAPKQAPNRTWALRFGEVRRHADVWLNGTYLGSNSLAYAPFDLPATSILPGQSNVLMVRVDSHKTPGSMPEDWWNWGGITQPVSLVPVGRVKLKNLGVMPELGCSYKCGDLLVQGTLRNVSQASLSPEITVEVTSPHGKTTTATHGFATLRPGRGAQVSFRVPVPGQPDLWAPGHPSLYKVRVATVTPGRTEQLDSMRVGLRSVQVRKGVLYLNGQRIWLHGASIHEDLPGRGAALTDGDISTIVSELRSVRANITRAHYLLDARLLNALDAAGILVWSQPPVDHADHVLGTPAGRVRALAALKATIIGARRHPSVIIESVGNELSPTPDTTPGTRAYLNQAIPIARQLDPAAAVALDTFCYPGFPAQQINKKVDVIGISHYFGWYPGIAGHSIANFDQLLPFLKQSHARYPNQALVVAEFGAEGLFDGSATTKGSYQFQDDYLEKTFKVLDQLPFMNGAIYWTLREFAVNPSWVGGAQLPPGDTPDGLHHKGLIQYNGDLKPAYSIAQRLFSELPSYVR